MKPSPDDNLPEVVPPRPIEVEHDSSPQAVTHHDVADHAWQAAERDKYPAIYDTTPKLLDDATKQDDTALPQPWSPSDANTITPVTTTLPWESLPAGSAAGNEPTEPTESEPRICGIRRRTFFILLAVVIVVVGAIIGGAVGGTVSRSAQTASDPSSQQQSTPPSSSATTSPSSTSSQSPTSASSSAQPKPTTLTLNNGTAPPGLAFQGFSEKFYQGGITRIIQEEGFHDLNVSALSYVWLPADTQCCLTFCASKTNATGYWCNARFRAEASGPVPRIYIWCGGNDGIKNETCS